MAFDLDDSPKPPANDLPTPPQKEASEILGSMPEPQQHAIDAAAAEGLNSEQPNTQGGDVDSAGEVWNSAYHSTGADGKGIKTAKGTWRRRRGAGASPRASKVYKPTDTSAAEAQAKTQELALANARVAGTAAASAVFTLGRALGGEGWAPTAEEVTAHNDAWTALALAEGWTFSPKWAVVICVSAYAGPRLFQEETRKRAGTLKQWIAVRIAKRKVKKELKKRGIIANVTIQGTAGVNPYDSILVDGKPFNEYPKGK